MCLQEVERECVAEEDASVGSGSRPAKRRKELSLQYVHEAEMEGAVGLSKHALVAGAWCSYRLSFTVQG